MNRKHTLALACTLAAFSFSGAASASAISDSNIVWRFTEVYSRTDTTPVPGEANVSWVIGSFLTTALTTNASGQSGYQLLEILDAGGWGYVRDGLTSTRGEDNFLLLTASGSVGLTSNGIGIDAESGTWTLRRSQLIGPAGGTYFQNFAAEAVPEPASYALVLAALGLMGTVRRKPLASAAA